MKQTLQSLLDQNQNIRNTFRAYPRSNGSLQSHNPPPIPSGMCLITINAGRNNTIVTLSNWNYRVLGTASGGTCGLRGHHRSSPESGTRSASRIAQLAISKGFKDAFLVFKGFGPGRDAAFRSVVASGIMVRKMTDKTPIQHGGCKPRKARRV